MVVIKSSREIELMHDSGKIAAEAMYKVVAAVKPGITTGQLDKIANEVIVHHGAKSSFKDYQGFPGNICTSVNDEIVHGIPGKKVLHEGDIVTIDLGAYYRGYHSDMARTVPVGRISKRAEKLIRITKECFYRGIEQAVIGNRISDIGRAVQQHAEGNGMSVVRELIGHGVGQNLHEQPDVPNYVTHSRGIMIRKGMTIAVEPMINLGAAALIWEDDGWTVRTRDGEYSAQYENTIAVTDSGPVILTKV